MDVCHIPGRLSVTPLRFCHVPRNLRLPRFLPSPLCTVAAAGNLRSEMDPSIPPTQNRMFFLGMGFVAQVFAQELKNLGWFVSGTCTSTLKKEGLEKNGYDIFLFDAHEPEQSTVELMKHHTHLVVSIPPVVGVGDPMLQHEELLRSKLMGGNIRWLCYLSSTGVYGDCGGARVDEDYPTKPASELAKLRLVAEKGWLKLGDDLGISAQVFRLGALLIQ